jgi:photosystem II PsbU protein
MKALVRILAVVLVVFSCFSYGGQASANTSLNPMDVKLTTEYGKKIDLNNSDIRDFRELRGFYPNLASKIIKNAPYEEVDDVLNISGLSATQQTRLQANLDKFTVTEPSKELIEGDDRINPGVY